MDRGHDEHAVTDEIRDRGYAMRTLEGNGDASHGASIGAAGSVRARGLGRLAPGSAGTRWRQAVRLAAATQPPHRPASSALGLRIRHETAPVRGPVWEVTLYLVPWPGGRPFSVTRLSWPTNFARRWGRADRVVEPGHQGLTWLGLGPARQRRSCPRPSRSSSSWSGRCPRPDCRRCRAGCR